MVSQSDQWVVPISTIGTRPAEPNQRMRRLICDPPSPHPWNQIVPADSALASRGGGLALCLPLRILLAVGSRRLKGRYYDDGERERERAGQGGLMGPRWERLVPGNQRVCRWKHLAAMATGSG